MKTLDFKTTNKHSLINKVKRRDIELTYRNEYCGVFTKHHDGTLAPNLAWSELKVGDKKALFDALKEGEAYPVVSNPHGRHSGVVEPKVEFYFKK